MPDDDWPEPPETGSYLWISVSPAGCLVACLALAALGWGAYRLLL